MKNKSSVLDHIMHLCAGGREPTACITAILLDLEVPTKQPGFFHLRQAIGLFRKNPAQQITKELYITVAAPYRGAVTATQVEHAIRRAIEKAWETCDPDKLELYFPHNTDRRPTNAAFISRLAYLVDMWEVMIGN